MCCQVLAMTSTIPVSLVLVVCQCIIIHPMRSKLSLDIAYRYYNGGTFETPSQVTDYNGLDRGYIEKGKPWRGTLQTNQLYFAMNFAI